MKNTFTLKEYRDFISKAEKSLFKAIDNEIEIPIKISVENTVIELPMDADVWNDICLTLKESYGVLYEELSQTRGNTKITSKDLIHRGLAQSLKETLDMSALLPNVYKRFIKACECDLILNDLAEQIRITNDLRPSEIEPLWEDFHKDKLFDIVEAQIKKILFEKFTVLYSKELDKSYLVFFGDKSYGEILDSVNGEVTNIETNIYFSDLRKQEIEDYFDILVEESYKEL